MELTGDLSDFALADILQILGLARKSGTLLLESGELKGIVCVDDGRIVHARLRPGESLADRLVREGLISSDCLHLLMKVAAGGIWTLRSLILDSGALSVHKFEAISQLQLRDCIRRLLSLEKGSFGLALNQLDVGDLLEEDVLPVGLEVSEVLLGAAQTIDEASCEGYSEAAGVALAQPGLVESSSGREGSTLLCSLLAELRSYSFEAEVSLLVMRYASEVASRGVLFVVKEDRVCGLGQFGVPALRSGKSADEMVRDIMIPIGGHSVFDDVIKTGQPFIGKLPDNYWHARMLEAIGGNGIPLFAFVLPITCNEQPVFLLYGDNYPGVSQVKGLDELMALVNQASIVLEKIVLEKRLRELSDAA
jgi:hypothetical protein